MKQRLVITDLTYMWDDQVCIAGVDREGNCIRPVIPGGVRRTHLFDKRDLLIHPRALIEFDLSPIEIAPPHIEDKQFDPDCISRWAICNDNQWEQILKSNCFPSVDEVFDGFLEEDRRVKPGARTRSLGTISDVQVTRIRIDDAYGRRQLRMDFVDSSGKRYNRYPVNDLIFRLFFQKTIDMLSSEAKAEGTAERTFASVDRIYLRIGLARPTQVGKYPETCWTQVTGVYTFPDYLGEKTFVDF